MALASPARHILTVFCAAVALAACGPSEEIPPELADSPGFRTKVFYLEAPCEVMVDGVGMVDVENDYIPGVVACENGGAPPEALRAQAVQARTFLYYKLFVTGANSVGNSQGSQVYSCSYRPNGPEAEHYAAAADTKGQYLTFENQIIASFYVAAAIPPNPDPNDPFNSCRGNGGDDPTGTENLVTYNRGKSGCDIQMSNQGLVTADCRDNPHNRGTASQNGQSCLANVGVAYDDMFTMYYGDDIQLVVADGRCGGDPLPEDEFCAAQGDGAHCFDAMTRIECAGGRAELTEECDFGCDAGVCVDEPNDDFCAGREDGSYCNDATMRTECAGEMTSLTESCDFGCGEGACVPEPSNDFCSGQADGAYCDGSVRVECVAEAISGSAACPAGCTGGSCDVTDGSGMDGGDDGGSGGGMGGGRAAQSGQFPPLVGPSPGVDGGCASVDARPDAVALLLGLLLFRARRRR